MSARNKFAILLSIVGLIALAYFLLSTPLSKDLVLIGTVDANQVVVSPQVDGRLVKLLVDEGSQVKAGDLIAVLDPAELQAEDKAALATMDSMKFKVDETESTLKATEGATTSAVANSEAKLSSAKAQLLQAQATLQRTESDSRRTIALAQQGVASDQDKVQAESNLAAQQAVVQSLKDQISAAEADLKTSIANRNQAKASVRTVESTRGQFGNAEALRQQAQVRLGYTNIVAPVTGTVSVRAARQGEVLKAGSPIVTIVDFNDTWVRAAIPETDADHIAIDDVLRVQMPGGTMTSGKVFFKSPEADFATQRDVSRRKRDIKTIVLKVRLDNPNGAYVPGMTADVLVSPDQVKGPPRTQAATAGSSKQ
jgi:HlyD family secretion protein